MGLLIKVGMATQIFFHARAMCAACKAPPYPVVCCFTEGSVEVLQIHEIIYAHYILEAGEVCSYSMGP